VGTGFGGRKSVQLGEVIERPGAHALMAASAPGGDDRRVGGVAVSII
jgi:hypothetical protein